MRQLTFKQILDRVCTKTNSWKKGQNPWITIDNPNRNLTNKRKIKVRANDIWGPPGVRMVIKDRNS